MRRKLLLIGFLLYSLLGLAQQPDSLSCQWLQPEDSPLLLDSLSVYPPSLTVAGLQADQYYYELSSGLIYFKADQLPDSVQVCYQTLPYALHQPLQKHTLAEYDSNALFRDNRKRVAVGGFRNNSLFEDENLQATGSLSRGISFGNTQSVFVQSALNLQLEGQLTDKIGIRGQITDQQVPYQPEGNTQNLQDFDNVLIELFTDQHRLLAGDLQLRADPAGHFMRYTKNVQGGNYIGTYNLAGGKALTDVSVSLTKGKFATVNIDPQEGVSGPYRLPLPGGQGFTIVLANSEQVYLDGQLLQRGYQADYVIDYNLGEITFSPSILITRNSRIRVDYEYADQAYSRSLITLRQEQSWDQFHWYSQLYRERDNPNRPLQQELSEEDKRELAEEGGDTEGLFLPAIVEADYSENQVQYVLRDTLLAGEAYQFYAFTSNPAETVYRLSFSFLGEGRGNYIPAEYTALGQVYAWVAPVNGEPQGTHEPVRRVVTPIQRTLWTNGIRWEATKSSLLEGELSLSGYDQNLYATDAGTNGMAGWFRYTFAQPKEKNEWHWLLSTEAEYLDADFTAIDRFRPVEFDRDWGLLYTPAQPLPELTNQQDYWMGATVGLEKGIRQRFRLSSTYRQKEGLVEGWQHSGSLLSYLGNVQLKGSASIMENAPEGAETENNWYRAEGGLRWEGGWLWPGYVYRLERNRTRRQADDFVLASIQDFSVHEWYLQSADSSRFRFRTAFAWQTDYLPLGGEAEEAIQARTYKLNFQSPANHWQQLNIELQHRENSFLVDSIQNQVPPQVTTGLLRWRAQAWHRALRTEWLYATGSSREIQRDFVYVEVATGEGTHTWRDDNENGIRELDEFFEALNPDERNYIRLFVPGNDFVTAFSSRLNMRLNFEPGTSWLEAVENARWLSRFALRLNVQLEQKNSLQGINRYLPWHEPDAENLIANRNRIQANLLYNPLNSRAGFDLGYQNLDRKQQLSIGTDQSAQKLYYWRGRLRLKQQHNLSLTLQEEQQQNFSSYLQENQYSIVSRSIRPEWSYVPGPAGQFSLYAEVQDKSSRLSENEAGIWEAGIEGRVSRRTKTQISGLLRQLYFAYDGATNTPEAYVILEGYRPGSNWNWNLNVQHQLLDGLLLTLTYDGRKPDEQDAIHIGRMSVSALF